MFLTENDKIMADGFMAANIKIENIGGNILSLPKA